MSTKRISPLRQRLIDDMTIRRLSPTTKVALVNSVKKCGTDCQRFAFH